MAVLSSWKMSGLTSADVIVRTYDRAAEGFLRAASRATPEELVLTPRYVSVVEQSEKEGEGEGD